MLITKLNVKSLSDITLARFKTWDMQGDRRGDVISCSTGNLWITQAGDLKDYILESGQDFWVTRTGTVVVQALSDSRFGYSLYAHRNHLETSRQPYRQASPSRINHRLR
ncbi:MAG: hypothetical protein A2136_06790 [Chloroflexi bacterium RBG_16_54_11]|nr:MAG: hypothetical protein A2136_06790 [Chloroflexi bacterium RBG_16_54_11]